MAQFNLDDYENVKERKKRFYADYPDGRIVVEQINNDPSVLDYAEFKAYVYLNAEDQSKFLPRGTGHALELREKEKSINKYGKEYESVNYTSWTENCEESAVGRALDNAGYASSPSKQEMMKVERHSEILGKNNQVNTDKGIKIEKVMALDVENKKWNISQRQRQIVEKRIMEGGGSHDKIPWHKLETGVVSDLIGRTISPKQVVQDLGMED